MFNLLSEITNISKDIDCSLKIEFQPRSKHNTPILLFQEGVIQLMVLTANKKNGSLIREKLITPNQAEKLLYSLDLEFVRFTVSEFKYRRDIYCDNYYTLPKFQKELKEFIEKIKDKTLKNI
jgi:paraquat-inducible protein B